MKLIVEFERDEAADAEVIGAKDPTPQQLVAQFVKEMQAAYDESWLAGSFTVVQINTDDGRNHKLPF